MFHLFHFLISLSVIKSISATKCLRQQQLWRRCLTNTLWVRDSIISHSPWSQLLRKKKKKASGAACVNAFHRRLFAKLDDVDAPNDSLRRRFYKAFLKFLHRFTKWKPKLGEGPEPRALGWFHSRRCKPARLQEAFSGSSSNKAKKWGDRTEISSFFCCCSVEQRGSTCYSVSQILRTRAQFFSSHLSAVLEGLQLQETGTTADGAPPPGAPGRRAAEIFKGSREKVRVSLSCSHLSSYRFLLSLHSWS